MSNTGEPLVSVVMATYNTGYPMIREAVGSLINQTYTNWELILIDDCSTEFNDFSFLDEYKDSRIKIFHNEENMGCTRCFNKGVRLAQGEYIARLDADDIALPHRFAKQVQFMQTHPETKVVSGGFKYFGIKADVSLCIPNNPEFIRTTLLLTNSLAHSTLMFRRTLFTEDGLYYDESFRYAQDYDLLVRICGRGIKITQLPECLVYIRTHGSQISAVNTKTRTQQRGFMSEVSGRQLMNVYGQIKDDVACRDALANCVLNDGITTKRINEWTRRTLEANKKNNHFNQHYLKLVYAERYASFMRLTGEKGCLGFALRNMGPELVQSFFIFCHRRALKHIYRMKYGSTGTKG